MSVRPAAVAGFFYPGTASELEAMLTRLLAGVREAASAGGLPKALIVPHAGYIYSGPTAAIGYATLKPSSGASSPIRRVILLGPSHRVAFAGAALPEAETFETPLGPVAIDIESLETARAYACLDAAAHALEHSLEVQLPFLQAVLPGVPVLPVCVGSMPFDDLVPLLRALWGGDETLIVVSSDLSHFHTYEEARAIDSATIERILAMQPGIGHDQACGATPVNALLTVSRELGLTSRLLDYRNSGDTAGDRQRVVGYTSIGFYEGGDA